MCGISGFFSTRSFSDNELRETLIRMGNTLNHRGPNDNGIWYDYEKNIGFSHRRLSILDLSSAGKQPMESKSGRFVITYNGELYNHLELRKKINKDRPGLLWRGHSDTETLLAGIDLYGLEKTIEDLRGMFAFALWDKKNSTLSLVRDRIGEKPLYYGYLNGTFLFASELKALKVHPSFRPDIDLNSLALFLRYSNVPAPASIYKNIFKLEPGSILTVTSNNFKTEPRRYWNIGETISHSKEENNFKTLDQASDSLENLIKQVVSEQMISDVPVGTFLSGGIDSSLVVALMQSQTSKPTKTFTIGFEESHYDEAKNARAIANILGTDHTEKYISPKEVLDVVGEMPSVYCEPFADSSQIPTYLVSKLAASKVSVALSGDAGDELFCGYNRYQFTSKNWSKFSKMPLALRKIISNIIFNISPDQLRAMGEGLPFFRNRINNLGDKMHKGAEAILAESIEDLYTSILSHHNNPNRFIIGLDNQKIINSKINQQLDNLTDIERMMHMDIDSYLPDDILVKLDRAAMASSLETRVPFLDKRIIEFAWSLPLDMKLYKGQTKWILKNILSNYIPAEMINQPKMGFAMPIDSWLRGPLRDWAESLLSAEKINNQGLFHENEIKTVWQEHLSGKRNWGAFLWNILMFQSWQDSQ